MKLSVEDWHSDDPEKAALCQRCIVTLNGNRVDYCLMADEENGLICRYVLDKDGNPVVEGEELRTETVTGEVRIIDPEKEQSE